MPVPAQRKKKIRVLFALTPHTTAADADSLGRLVRDFRPQVVSPWAPGKSPRGLKRLIRSETNAILGEGQRNKHPFKGRLLDHLREYFASEEGKRLFASPLGKPRIYPIERTHKTMAIWKKALPASPTPAVMKNQSRMLIALPGGRRRIVDSVKGMQILQVRQNELARSLRKQAIDAFRSGNLPVARRLMVDAINWLQFSTQLRYDEMQRGIMDFGGLLNEHPELKNEPEIRVLAIQGGVHTKPYHEAKHLEGWMELQKLPEGFELEFDRVYPGKTGRAVVFTSAGEAIRMAQFKRNFWTKIPVYIKKRAMRILMEETLEEDLRSRFPNSTDRFKVCRALADELLSKTRNPRSALDQQAVEDALPGVLARLKERRLI